MFLFACAEEFHNYHPTSKQRLQKNENMASLSFNITHIQQKAECVFQKIQKKRQIGYLMIHMPLFVCVTTIDTEY